MGVGAGLYMYVVVVQQFTFAISSPGEFLFIYAIARPSVVCLSVTFVRPTQAIQIFGNISTALGTLAIH